MDGGQGQSFLQKGYKDALGGGGGAVEVHWQLFETGIGEGKCERGRCGRGRGGMCWKVGGSRRNCLVDGCKLRYQRSVTYTIARWYNISQEAASGDTWSHAVGCSSLVLTEMVVQ